MTQDTVVVSDVHLGSPISCAADLLCLLKQLQFRRLILLGDIFQDLDFSRLTREHWNLVSYLRKLSNPKRGVEVVWVEGNHDVGIIQVMEHLLGIKAFRQYTWESEGKKCIAIHGHQFDALWARGTPWLGRILTRLYLKLQAVDFLQRWLPVMLDRLHTHWERLTAKVAEGALRYASEENADYIFCGHTHQVYSLSGERVQYFNVGCWVGGNGGTYALVNKGRVSLQTYPQTIPAEVSG